LNFFFFENSNLALGLNQYVDQTQRVTTGIDGKIVLQEVFFLFWLHNLFIDIFFLSITTTKHQIS